eukprot:3098701-Rhodomonas_salina.1
MSFGNAASCAGMLLGASSNQALSTGIRSLIRQGILTPKQLWSRTGGGWRIHANLSRDELNTVLLGLEHCFPGTKRYSVLTDVRKSSSATQMEEAASSPPVVPEEMPRSVSPQAASGEVHVDISSPARSDPTTAQATSSAIFF